MIFKRSALLFPVIFLCGCATVSTLITRDAPADNLAKENGFKKRFIKTSRFQLTSYYKFTAPGDPITIYIEGDGLAWLSPGKLSDDPTPQKPFVLELASIDPSKNVAYIARPGQYTESGIPDCGPEFWSTKRFSEDVIVSMNEAISELSSNNGSKAINLIGYSGGAAIAILVAARRGDVTSLRTIAGNLDHRAVNQYNSVSPLDGSLNPIDFADKIADIPQRHFVCANDSVVPIFIAESFAGKIGDKRYESITIVEGTGHSSGWQKAWPPLLKFPLYERSGL